MPCVFPLAVLACMMSAPGPDTFGEAWTPDAYYWILVGDQTSGRISQLRFGPDGTRYERGGGDSQQSLVRAGRATRQRLSEREWSTAEELCGLPDGASSSLGKWYSVTFSPDDQFLYVPCSTGSSEVLEIARSSFAVTRRIPTGERPHTADISPDGRFLVVSLFDQPSVAIVDRLSGVSTRVETTQPQHAGIAISPDSRYAFVSNEAEGADRGSVDVIDLESKVRVATVEVEHQPGEIEAWKMAGAQHQQ